MGSDRCNSARAEMVKACAIRSLGLDNKRSAADQCDPSWIYSNLSMGYPTVRESI